MTDPYNQIPNTEVTTPVVDFEVITLRNDRPSFEGEVVPNKEVVFDGSVATVDGESIGFETTPDEDTHRFVTQGSFGDAEDTLHFAISQSDSGWYFHALAPSANKRSLHPVSKVKISTQGFSVGRQANVGNNNKDGAVAANQLWGINSQYGKSVSSRQASFYIDEDNNCRVVNLSASNGTEVRVPAAETSTTVDKTVLSPAIGAVALLGVKPEQYINPKDLRESGPYDKEESAFVEAMIKKIEAAQHSTTLHAYGRASFDIHKMDRSQKQVSERSMAVVATVAASVGEVTISELSSTLKDTTALNDAQKNSIAQMVQYVAQHRLQGATDGSIHAALDGHLKPYIQDAVADTQATDTNKSVYISALLSVLAGADRARSTSASAELLRYMKLGTFTPITQINPHG